MPSRPSFYTTRLDRVDGIDVWRVDGHRVRDHLDVDFTNGHHHYTRRYVPIDEIWLDREAPGAGEWPFWALRQVEERARMARGQSYLTALRASSRAEKRARQAAEPPEPSRGAIKDSLRQRPIGKAAGR